jgi:hypothetical protein
MPYITEGMRKEVEVGLQTLITNLERKDGLVLWGQYNYVITRLLLTIPHSSYGDIQGVIGLLECIKQEFYRRVAVPYEQNKIEANGDLSWRGSK